MTATDAPTCAALLTAPGAGAIAVIRVYGVEAAGIVSRLCRRKDGSALHELGDGQVRRAWIHVGGEVLDDVVISRRSEENSVDLCTHGGTRIVERVLDALDRLGARLRNPEDVQPLPWPSANRIEEESIREAVNARTEAADRFLGRQRRHLANAVQAAATHFQKDAESGKRAVSALLAGYLSARTLIEGRRIALVGPTNSGKSTLFNALAGRTAAVVSPMAGTTRDWVEVHVEMDGVPVTLIDTAGLNPQAAALELQAIGRGREISQKADARLLVLDGSQPPAEEEVAYLADSPVLPTAILTVTNKNDLGLARPSVLSEDHFSRFERPLSISAKTGEGLQRLVTRLLACVGFDSSTLQAAALFTKRQAELATDILALPGRSTLREADDLFHRLIDGDK